MDELRADALLDLLTGEGIAAGGPITDGTLGLSDPDPDNATAADAAWAPPPTEPPREYAEADPAETEELPEPAPPADPHRAPHWDDVWDMWRLPPDDGLDPTQPDTPAERARWLASFDRLATARPATWCVLCGHRTGEGTPHGPMPGPRRGTIELVATTDTLMGLADLPAEITGMGPVTADVARQVAAQMRDAQWRFSVYDPLKHLMHHGTTTARPAEDGDGYEHSTSRFPTTEQAWWVKARDRMCVAPGCRQPARRCEVDHTLAWVKGGETVHCNMSLLCKRHHLFKHATGSELVQPAPGIFRWRTPAGLQYQTRSDPPLLLDTNQLAGVPKPPNPDSSQLAANLTAEQWMLPSALGAHPDQPRAEDVLLPEDIDDPDNLPVPDWLLRAGAAGHRP